MKKIWKVTLRTLPLLGPLLLFIITKNEYIVSLGILLFMALTFKIKYYKREWIIFIVGIICGIVGELGGDLIYKLQYWDSGSFFGIPLWLPLFWGYGFVFMRRIGNLIVKNKEN
jgi:general stress protein CsbA